MSKTIAGAALLAGLVVPAAAQAQQQTPPPPPAGTVVKGKAPVAQNVLDVKLPRPAEFALPNGVRVFVLADKRLPLVSFSLSFKAGTLFEPKPGVADLAAAMLDEGTTTRSAAQLANETEQIGASLRASAGSELASVSASGLSEYTDQIVALMADVLLHPAFLEGPLARLKAQTVQGLVQQRADPTFVAREIATRVYYGDTPYGRVSPQPDQISAITAGDLRAFHEAFYRPNGAILGIVGDVDAPVIVEKFKTALAGWKPAASEPQRPSAADLAPQAATRVYLVDRPGSTQTVLAFGNLAISRTDPDYVPLVVANQILGGGSSGRLFQNLREVKGYTYGAYSQIAAPKWVGTWGASASVQTKFTQPAVGEFLAEFKRLQTEPASQIELDAAKRALVGSFARTLESPSGVLARTLELVQNGLPLDYWDRYPALVQAVTPADIQRVGQKYLGQNRLQLIAVGERAAIETGLAQYGPITVYDASGKPLSQ